MFALVSLVLAVVAAGSEAYFIPYGNFLPQTYSGIPVPRYYAGAHVAINANTPLAYSYPQAYTAVTAAAATPVVAAPATPVVYSGLVQQVPQTVQSLYHAQDELGGYQFGHSSPSFSKQETRDHFGNVAGSYNYIDADGQTQTTHYTAGAGGFKVAASNIPVAPAVADLEAPVPVQDTPEVVQAKTAFKAAFDKAVGGVDSNAPSRKKRSPVIQGAPFYNPYYYGGFPSPLTYTAGASTPLTYAAPVVHGAGVRAGELLRIHNNPGYAVSYRVY